MHTRAGRIPILDLSPQISDNRWPARAFAGEVVPFAATAFREGHDRIGVSLLLTAPNGVTSIHPMTLLAAGTDRFGTDVQLHEQGTWTYLVRAYADDFATWKHNATVKIEAGVDVELMFTLGEQLLATAGHDTSRTPAERRAFAAAAATLADNALPTAERLAAADNPKLLAWIGRHPLASLSSESESRDIIVERTRAGVGAWYEFFPRSEGAKRAKDGSWQSGTFRTAARRLPAVAAMGFDVLYLPPIHPIGTAFRKGPNNTLDAGPHDPGSPWAIGSAAGGHDAIHPDLGTLKDFSYFVGKAASLGIEVAIDLALQASPDHPWVTEHPEWFTTLPDGTIAYAENPPKKYQDIYPINFDNDPEGIRVEVLRIVRHWISYGIRIFRVEVAHDMPLDHCVYLEEERSVRLCQGYCRDCAN